jgi:hypothetical protein
MNNRNSDYTFKAKKRCLQDADSAFLFLPGYGTAATITPLDG